MTPAKLISRFTPLAFAVALTGCVVLPPAGPSYQALPGSRLSYDQFQVDDAACRQYATAQVGGRSAPESAQESAAASTVAGTMLGAAAGAAFGGSSESAAVGAGIGLLTGAMIGLSTSEASYYAVQGRYDGAYYQCMYARGHRVPVSSRYAETRRAPVAPVAPPADAAVPPPNAPPPAAPYVPPYWPSAPR